MFLKYQNQVCKQNKPIREKRDDLLKMSAERQTVIKGKQLELEVLPSNIQDLKKEFSREKPFPLLTKIMKRD